MFEPLIQQVTEAFPTLSQLHHVIFLACAVVLALTRVGFDKSVFYALTRFFHQKSKSKKSYVSLPSCAGTTVAAVAETAFLPLTFLLAFGSGTVKKNFRYEKFFTGAVTRNAPEGTLGTLLTPFTGLLDLAFFPFAFGGDVVKATYEDYLRRKAQRLADLVAQHAREDVMRKIREEEQELADLDLSIDDADFDDLDFLDLPDEDFEDILPDVPQIDFPDDLPMKPARELTPVERCYAPTERLPKASEAPTLILSPVQQAFIEFANELDGKSTVEYLGQNTYRLQLDGEQMDRAIALLGVHHKVFSISDQARAYLALKEIHSSRVTSVSLRNQQLLFHVA